MELKIYISRAAVMERIITESVYLAGRAQDADVQAFDKLYVTDDDRMLLDSYFNDALSALIEALDEYMSDCTSISASASQRDDCTLTLHLPSHVSASVSSLPSDAQNYVANAVLSDYLARLNDARSKLYSDSANVLLQSVITKINSRKRLTRSDVLHKILENVQ